MAEILESMARVSEGLRAANAAGEALNSVSSLLESSRFYAHMGEIGFSAEGTFAFEGNPGEIRLTNTGEVVDLESAIKNVENYGDILAAMRDLKVPEEALEERPVQRYAADYKVRWENQAGNLDIKAVEDVENTGEEIESKVGEPTSVSDMTEKINSDSSFAKEMNKRFDELKKKVDEARGGGREFKTGKWVKRVVFAGGVVVAAAAIYKEINKHKAIMNGCWLVDIRTGEKCKIAFLTCHDTTADELKYMCESYNVCGDDGLSPCFSPDTCVKHGVDGECTQTIGKCQVGTCNALCSHASTLKIPPGKRLQCVSVNFWGAAEDFLGETLTGIFGKNFWWYVGLVGVALVVVLVLTR